MRPDDMFVLVDGCYYCATVGIRGGLLTRKVVIDLYLMADGQVASLCEDDVVSRYTCKNPSKINYDRILVWIHANIQGQQTLSQFLAGRLQIEIEKKVGELNKKNGK